MLKYDYDWGDVMRDEETKDIATKKMADYLRSGMEFKLDRDASERLYRLCELADTLAEEFGAEEIGVHVDPSDRHGVIWVDTDEVIFEYGRSHQFFGYMEYSDFLRFAKTGTGLLRICFGVENLWKSP